MPFRGKYYNWKPYTGGNIYLGDFVCDPVLCPSCGRQAADICHRDQGEGCMLLLMSLSKVAVFSLLQHWVPEKQVGGRYCWYLCMTEPALCTRVVPTWSVWKSHPQLNWSQALMLKETLSGYDNVSTYWECLHSHSLHIALFKMSNLSGLLSQVNPL